MDSDTHNPLLESAQGHVYLVEDDADMRDSISTILESRNYRVYPYADPERFLQEVSDRPWPCVLLLDMRLPHMSGVHVQSILQERGIDMPIVFVSGESTILQAVTAIQAGAAQFLVKPVSRQALLAAVGKALELEQQKRAQLHARMKQEKLVNRLTPREREVMGCLLRGMGNSEIAGHLGISAATVKQHKAIILIKLDVRTVSELFKLLPGWTG